MDLGLVQHTLKKDNIEIHKGDIVLIRAWRGNWLSPEFHRANGLSIDAAKWLRGKGMKAVGIDLGNIEDNADMTRQVHLYLLAEKVPIFENLANLGSLPVTRFFFAGFPLYLENCTGSPVRAVALIHKNGKDE